jgi:hypothetical protein
VPIKTPIGESITKEKRFYYSNRVNRKKALYLVEMVAAILDEPRLPVASELAEVIKCKVEDIYTPTIGLYPVPTFLEASEFAARYLNRSKDGEKILMMMLSANAFNIDWISLEEARDELPNNFKRKFNAEPGTRERKKARKLAKKNNFSLNVRKSITDRARLWVMARLVHGDQMEAMEEFLGDRWDEDTRWDQNKYWSHQLAPLDNAVGLVRKPGRPRTGSKMD